jgi:plastocyanin
MRKLPVFVLLALALSACVKNTDQQVEATSASPGVNPSLSPTVESISPTSAAKAYPSGSPAASGTGTVSCTTAESGEVKVTAKNLSFSTPCISVASGPVTVELRNQDSTAHTFSIYRGDTEVFKGKPTAGGEDRTYEVPALGAGTYRFQCDIHPSMNGTFVVGKTG